MVLRRGGIAMTEEQKNNEPRSEQNSRTHRRNLNKMDHTLNYLIAIVSILIVLTLIIIFVGNDDKDSKELANDEQQENVDKQTGKASEDEEQDEQSNSDESESQEQQTPEEGTDDSDKVTVNASDDPIVAEVWQNENWQPYTTAQYGSHVSTYKAGHIDYEEKLAAIYSVIPLTKEDSVLWRIKNNGNASTAIAVLSSKDKVSKYRVSIEWIDGHGWKPVLVEVLNTLEGAY